jgi:hypothetical protein
MNHEGTQRRTKEHKRLDFLALFLLRAPSAPLWFKILTYTFSPSKVLCCIVWRAASANTQGLPGRMGAGRTGDSAGRIKGFLGGF